MVKPATVGVLLLLALSACEAPLNLEAVQRSQSEPIRRSDQFQAAAANDAVVVVVGNQGLVLTSADQGGTWQRTELPGWPALIGVTGCPDGTLAALAAEGFVWVSKNDGAEWTAHPIDTEEAPQDVTCGPDNRIWVVGSFSSIFVSDEAGESWDYTSLDEDLILTNVQFVDAQRGYISGEFGTVLRTTDGGENWERLPELEDSFYPQDMYFADTARGWVVGLQGHILYTGDGGESWEMQTTATRAPVYGIAAVGGTEFAVGGEGTLLRREGRQWLDVDHGKPILLYLRAVHPVGDDRLLIAGQAGALYVVPAASAAGSAADAQAPPDGFQGAGY